MNVGGGGVQGGHVRMYRVARGSHMHVQGGGAQGAGRACIASWVQGGLSHMHLRAFDTQQQKG